MDDNNVFKKRSGTTDRGKDYENLMVASLIPKLLHKQDLKDFYLTSNDEKFGAFDDVVLETELRNGSKQIQALQLKHYNKEKVLTKNALLEKRGNFSIKKYFEDFKMLPGFDAPVTCILFTNLKFNIPDGDEIEMKDEGVRIKILEMSPDSLLNTSNGRCYKFETSDEEYQGFFKQFLLFTNQMNVDKLKLVTVKNFEEMFSCESSVVRDFLNFVNEWSIKEGKKPKLDKSFMEHAISLYLLSSSIVPFAFGGYVNSKSKLFREAISKFKTTVLDIQHTEKLRQVYSDAYNELKDLEEVNKIAVKYQISLHYVNNIEELTDLNQTKVLWLLGKHPCYAHAPQEEEE